MSEEFAAVSQADFEAFHDAVQAVAAERMTGMEDRRALRRLQRNGPLARLASRRAMQEYIEDGGDVGDLQSILDWLIQNWPQILEMIKAIIALFS